MISEEGAELVRPPRKREKDIGNEARFFLDRLDPLADVVWQIGEIGGRKSADRRRAHGARPSLFCLMLTSPLPRREGRALGSASTGSGSARFGWRLRLTFPERPVRNAAHEKKSDNFLTGRLALRYCF